MQGKPRLSKVLSFERRSRRAGDTTFVVFRSEIQQSRSRFQQDARPMTDDPYAERKKLTFAQAEGVEPLPRQLALKELSPQLRARLWCIIHESMNQGTSYPSMGGDGYYSEAWRNILYRKHVVRDHRMADEFRNNAEERSKALKAIFNDGDYVAVLGLVEWLLCQQERPIRARQVQHTFETCRAAYRLLDDERTIVPITSLEERATLNRAFADLATSEFDGARAHLRAAVQLLTEGSPSDSVRESIHAVESVARTLAGTNSLSGALQKLKSKRIVHPALERAFNSLYGFTSDEKGIRQALLDDGTANVDETDAVFMIGACASFVSYLIGRTRPDRAS